MDFSINFDEKNRKFVAEQSLVLLTGLKFLQNEKLKDNIPSSGDLSIRDLSKFTDKSNQRC